MAGSCYLPSNREPWDKPLLLWGSQVWALAEGVRTAPGKTSLEQALTVTLSVWLHGEIPSVSHGQWKQTCEVGLAYWCPSSAPSLRSPLLCTQHCHPCQPWRTPRAQGGGAGGGQPRGAVAGLLRSGECCGCLLPKEGWLGSPSATSANVGPAKPAPCPNDPGSRCCCCRPP